ncbi:MAG: hypothetical protein ABSB40_06165 [Nitrososphaeria archaeon]|jgi:hypothetical protein
MSEIVKESVDNCSKIIELLEQSAEKIIPNESKEIVLKTIDFLKEMEKKVWIRTVRGKEASLLVKSNTEKLKDIIQCGTPIQIIDQANKLEESISKMQREFEKSKWLVT